MESIVQLLISMIVAYEEYGDAIGYTKEELDNFIQQYELVKLNWNELGALVLYHYKYITKEQFAKVMELEVDEDGEFWMEFNDFEDALPSDFDFEAKVLNGDMWEDWQRSDYYDYDFSFNDFSEETLKSVIEYCDKNDCSIDVDDEDIFLTKDNLRIENGNIYFGDEDLDEHMKDGGMEDLKLQIQFGISDAHDNAESDAVYNAVNKNFKEGIGSYKWVSTKKGEKNVEMLWVKVEVDLDDVIEKLKDDYTYRDETDYSSGSYGNMYYVLREFDFINMKKPNFDYLYSSPTTKDTDECVRNRLY